jgi:hypothetical protein
LGLDWVPHPCAFRKGGVADEKFITHGDPENLSDIRELTERQKNAEPRPHVIAAYLASLERFATLYKRLAD